MVLAMALLFVALGLIFDHWPAPDGGLLFFLAIPLLGAIVNVSRQRRHPEWVRVSDAGIELANGDAPIFIRWTNVASASVRGRPLFATLDIVPADLTQVTSPAPHGTVPALHQLPGGTGFRIQVSHLLPGPRALNRALSLHQS
ncbi:hypothetical protein [Paractinoplanes atraurantiacus]|nr:hypothetical protein [Actinoplanes atraurantiacus]